MKHPKPPPVDGEFVEYVMLDGRRVPVAVWRDLQEIDPATGDRQWHRRISLLPAANGSQINPSNPRLSTCHVCGLGPLNQDDLRRCYQCERSFCVTQCLGLHEPGPDNTMLYLCVDCARRARRIGFLQFLFSVR